MQPVLILTAGFGEGHNAAARNLAAAIDRSEGPGTALVKDLFEIASPRINEVSRRAYLSMINRLPRLWCSVYRFVDRNRPFPRHLWFLRKEMRVLEELLRTHRPAFLCSTYPVYGFMADRLRAAGRFHQPFHNIVTDSISINSLWTRTACDGWYVPNAETAEVLRSQQVPVERIHDLGFPVQVFFEGFGASLRPPELSQGATPKVLYMMHSGVRQADATARALLSESDWDLCFAVGRDERLRRRLIELSRTRKAPTTVLSWTDQIPRLLLTHHVLISKAGGATTQEAIAACCPMIVNQIVPGQEEGNYELLKQRNLGAYAQEPQAIMEVLRRAFANRGSLWSEWRAGLRTIARPDAARRIAEHLITRWRAEQFVPKVNV